MAHKLIAKNFQSWIGLVRECVDQIKDGLAEGIDLDTLSTYVLAIIGVVGI
jgi:hypothetical protein